MIVDDSYGNLTTKFDFKININLEIPTDMETYYNRMGCYGSYGPHVYVINIVNKYCIDRYWSKLDKIFIFKNKLGYQKPSLSNITKYLNINLD